MKQTCLFILHNMNNKKKPVFYLLLCDYANIILFLLNLYVSKKTPYDIWNITQFVLLQHLQKHKKMC